MKKILNMLATLISGLLSYLATLGLQPEPSLIPFAAMGTTVGAALLTAAYGLHGRDVIAAKIGTQRQWVLFVIVFMICFFAYEAVFTYTYSPSALRFWALASLVWVMFLLLSALTALCGILAAEKTNTH
jgi:hypothetical protein